MFDEGIGKIKYKILIVEDSLFNQMILRRILEGSYTIETATTAEDARVKVHTFEPHLILLDIILPDANGFDVLMTLKQSEDTQNIPVIIITGLESDEDEEKGFLLGAVDYIKRPFKNAIVLARVNTQIHIIKQIQTIEQLSLLDGLTGIANRRALDIQVQYEWSRAVRERSWLSMMMLDVDKFKEYNDTYGHRHGDFMLQTVAQTLKQELESVTDFFYRYGGDEFAILLPGMDAEGARPLAQRLVTSVGQILFSAVGTQSLCSHTISLGSASIQPQLEQHPAVLLERADKKLYLAKQNGRNQAQCD
ncbi:GGDEF domain-containing response regulator [Faecalispora anaeroviscerum]|uniref:GGDEF domain-containing response regulator n=1 Tax=Faecalispora anaeroviscerum TaxID=2991836 RepID=UPI0024B978AB|nr:diguanylate cyclase [Faecalispora anaeroviscerum]